MKTSFRHIAALLVAFPLSLAAAAPASKPDIRLWRLDCGSLWTYNLDEMSDTRAYVGRSGKFVGSCYLVRHGSDYLLWDTGLSREYLGKSYTEGDADSTSLAVTVVDQLARIGVEPAQVSMIGISHYHLDHVGQAADFPQAKLLIGEGDFAVLGTPGHEARTKLLSPWLGKGARLEKVKGDLDVFGDGSVVMLDLPGHTPGHHGLLVQLPKHGPVLLSGDVVHFRENLESSGVPSFNTDRAQSLSSMDRFVKLARNLDATLIIQHEEQDVAKLPAFPQAAE
ncbi:glyoxylase-like metal-dependent hydrolase (beta-lactamase superfamily II) [Luteimonas cucumeris]|uniref:Glyoxylase-like metal-dependent hydrolase (Beta-lactamase superfamily II) n=1 Tax=Luteimonas cucumeris TaxID=985012 RepID=A0A562LAJ4_9GAMM|nr:N-acyl homoserine lactonase family protein [Luteimonas cucumeris]TWI04628.1 glyoxylase-like metal-dependent hydrolase (beta-lactamase superfamily II) [Luteimonas cucumeris]